MTITIFLNGTLVLDRTSRIQTTPPLPAPIPWPPDESPKPRTTAATVNDVQN